MEREFYSMFSFFCVAESGNLERVSARLSQVIAERSGFFLEKI